MPPVTHLAWRFASCVFLSRVPMERGCHAQMRGVTWRLQDACFKGAFTELWRPQRILYRAVEAMNTVVSVTTALCQGPLALPSTLPKFPRTGFFVSLRDTSQSSPSPHSGCFLPPLISFVWLAQPLPSSLPFLLSPLTTTPTPLPACQGLCNTLVPPGPWATSSLFQGQELQSSGKYHSGVARSRHWKKPQPSRVFSLNKPNGNIWGLLKQHFRQNYLEELLRTESIFLSKPQFLLH